MDDCHALGGQQSGLRQHLRANDRERSARGHPPERRRADGRRLGAGTRRLGRKTAVPAAWLRTACTRARQPLDDACRSSFAATAPGCRRSGGPRRRSRSTHGTTANPQPRCRGRAVRSRSGTVRADSVRRWDRDDTVCLLLQRAPHRSSEQSSVKKITGCSTTDSGIPLPPMSPARTR